jgi:hypothetical protein
MSARRLNPYLIKMHRSYATNELAARLGVHKNTVRQWQRDGLRPIDDNRPALFQGAVARDFLVKRNAGRKRPCPPGTFYCFRCREPRQPALGMVDYVELRPGTGDLCAMCETCETSMHRRARMSALATTMPGIAVQIREAPSRLNGRSNPSPYCDLERLGAA